MTDFAKFAGCPYFYNDVITVDYILPDIVNPQNPQLLPALRTVYTDSYDNARKLIGNSRFGLASSAEEAFKSALLAIALAPKKHRSLYDDKEYREFKSQESKVRELAAKCFSFAPEQPEYYYIFGLLYLKLGAIEEGVKLLEEALKKKPDLARVHVALALIYTICEDWEQGYIHALAARNAGLEIQADLMTLCLFACAVKTGQNYPGKIRLDSQSPGYKYSIQDALEFFPKLEGELDHSGHDRKIIMAPSDVGYFFQHTLALACSLEKNDPDSALHINLCNPTDEALATIEKMRARFTGIKIFLSTEQVDYRDFISPGYYLSAVRDVRLYQLMKQNNHRFIRLDVDSLIVKPLGKTGKLFDKNIILTTSQAVALPYWERLINGLKSVKKSAESLKFMEELTLLIFDNFRHKSHLWFLDQVYMVYLYDKYKNQFPIGQFPIGVVDSADYMDLLHSEISAIWTVTRDKAGAAKYLRKKHALLREYGFEEYIDA